MFTSFSTRDLECHMEQTFEKKQQRPAWKSSARNPSSIYGSSRQILSFSFRASADSERWGWGVLLRDAARQVLEANMEVGGHHFLLAKQLQQESLKICLRSVCSTIPTDTVEPHLSRFLATNSRTSALSSSHCSPAHLYLGRMVADNGQLMGS